MPFVFPIILQDSKYAPYPASIKYHKKRELFILSLLLALCSSQGSKLPTFLQLGISSNTMIPKCFSHPDSHSSASQLPQNLITCVYQTRLCNSPTHLSLTWSKTHHSHSLTIYAADSFSVTISLHPSTFSFFRARPGSKSICLTHQHYQRIKLHWDFTRAEFSRKSAEPDSRFYLAISRDSKVEFFLGDLPEEMSRRHGLAMTRQLVEPTLLSRREHVFGRKSYTSRAKFLGSKHEIGIECNGDLLKLKIDGETSLVVKRLAWKFRGNERIHVGGVEVDFFWDVFNWVNANSNSDGTSSDEHGNGHGVFIFQVGDGGVCPEMVGPEKKLMRKSLSSPAVSAAAATPGVILSPSPSCSSVLQWAEESSDCGRSSCSSPTSRSYGPSSGGFSLLLYAWRKD